MEEALQNPHPYSPRDLHLPGYVPVLLPLSTILGVYISACLLVMAFVWVVSGRLLRRSALDRLIMCWFAMSGLTHLVLEGYYLFSPEFYKDASGFYLSEVWKEYSRGDSRYAARDSSIISIEIVTILMVGPACLLAAYAIAAEKAYDCMLQFAVSLAHLYGTVIYFLTAYLKGDHFAASTFFYYAYYVIANAPWVVVPSLIAIRSWKKACGASSVTQGRNKAKSR